MFSFEYIHTSYSDMINDLAVQLGVKTKDNWLFFPEDVASGYYRVLQLSNGLDVNIINCRINKDWLLRRKSDDTEYYTLRFDELTLEKNIKIGIDADVVEKQKETVAVAYLTSSLFDWFYHGTKGTTFKAVNILIPKAWLGKLMGIEVFDDILPAYIALKSRSFNMEPLDTVYYQLMKEIMQEDPDMPFPHLYIENRVQLLLERFFTRIHSRVSLADVETNIKQDDIYTVFKIEKLLVENFSEKPKSIEELSRRATMSSTKLKKIFKSVYGVPIYEYYQQKRMQRAGELLSTGKYSVKQVAGIIGYSNMSNFTIAFKKYMNQEPSEFTNA
ncbi:AraC-like DNA-binding protein [Lacibacter cauensis]|uniref:AraC-like DNA-binding protein n=1 Tax=Lacibacter cauensis TaxID=510947 RepID=A0A562SEC7_9BACT|nr:helix-turn-helix domain-containing protein [Lacibacter cauensis]TWI79433.1 AraC-like DNA-binding protein [Lacibacter cauensis]